MRRMKFGCENCKEMEINVREGWGMHVATMMMTLVSVKKIIVLRFQIAIRQIKM